MTVGKDLRWLSLVKESVIGFRMSSLDFSSQYCLTNHNFRNHCLMSTSFYARLMNIFVDLKAVRACPEWRIDERTYLCLGLFVPSWIHTAVVMSKKKGQIWRQMSEQVLFILIHRYFCWGNGSLVIWSTVHELTKFRFLWNELNFFVRKYLGKTEEVNPSTSRIRKANPDSDQEMRAFFSGDVNASFASLWSIS